MSDRRGPVAKGTAKLPCWPRPPQSWAILLPRVCGFGVLASAVPSVFDPNVLV